MMSKVASWTLVGLDFSRSITGMLYRLLDMLNQKSFYSSVQCAPIPLMLDQKNQG